MPLIVPIVHLVARRLPEADMRLGLSFFAIIFVTSMSVTGAQKIDDRLPVFVKSGATAGGFTDPSKTRQDSTRDLIKKLSESKSLRSVDAEELAIVRLEVLDRSTARESNVSTAIFGSRQNKSSLTVRLTAGEYATEFTGESGSKGVLTGYGDAAKKIVKQLEEWVKSNKAQLATLKN